MYIRHCGITGFKVDTGDNNEVLCDKCCFNNAPTDCMNHVPCKFGWYYKETKTRYPFNGANENAVDLLLMKEAPATQIEHKKTTNTWVGLYGNDRIVESKSYLSARIACLKDMKRHAIDAIMSSERKKQKGVYVYPFRGVTVGIEHSKKKAKSIAIRNIKDYFDIIIEKELSDGASEQS